MALNITKGFTSINSFNVYRGSPLVFTEFLQLSENLIKTGFIKEKALV